MAWTTPDTYVVGQLLTAATMNRISGNMREVWHDLDVQTRNTSVTAGIGIYVDVLTSASVTADGTNPLRILFSAGEIGPGGGTSFGRVTEDGTQIGVVTIAAGVCLINCDAVRVPAAGSHVYKVQVQTTVAAAGLLSVGMTGNMTLRIQSKG